MPESPRKEPDAAAEPIAVVCPDKFRGSIDASEATSAMARGLRRAGWEVIRELPLADGGEGTLDALVRSRGAEMRVVEVTGPLGDRVRAEYGILRDGTAVIEMARASGLVLVEGRNDPLRATTAGTGELIAAAARNGATRLVVAVGGSATTDGGLGAVEALRWSLRGLDVVVACDVRTSFVDAARIFGPQKGAGTREIELLTRRLRSLVDRYRRETGVDVAGIPGAGAAGGLAGGLAALGARLEPGFETVASIAGLDEALVGATLVVTGEGSVDRSSFEGKVVGGVLRWSRTAGVPRLAIVAGRIADDDSALVPEDVEVETLLNRARDERDSVVRASLLVEDAAVAIGRRAD